MIYFVYHRSRFFSQASLFTLVFFFRHTMCSILFRSLILLFGVRFSNGHSSCRGQTHFRQKHSLALFSFICVIRWPSLIRFFCQWTSIKAWTGHVQLITNMSSQYRCSTQFRWTLSWRSRSHVEVRKSFASVVSQVTGTIIFLFTSTLSCYFEIRDDALRKKSTRQSHNENSSVYIICLKEQIDFIFYHPSDATERIPVMSYVPASSWVEIVGGIATSKTR